MVCRRTAADARRVYQLLDGPSGRVDHNVRTAFEHAVYVCLVANEAFESSALERLDHRSITNWMTIANAGIDDEPDPFLEFLRSFPEEIMPLRRKEEDWVTHFEQVCNRFEESEELYLIYRVLSSLVHPGFMTAVPYIEPILMRTSDVTDLSSKKSPGTMLLTLSFGNCAWTLSALDAVTKADTFSDLISELTSMSMARLAFTVSQGTSGS